MRIDNPMTATAVVLAAPFVGSFLGTVVTRVPKLQPVLLGRSHCADCGTTLGPLELIPLLSYCALGGKCRHCDAAIDPMLAVVETGATALALWAALVTSGVALIASCVLGWTLLTLAAIDWRERVLPDVLTLPLLALGLVFIYALDPGSILDHVIGAATGFTIFAATALLYRRIRARDGLGLGDAKLLAASGAWLGWIGLPSTILLAALLTLGAALIQSMRGSPLKSSSSFAFGPALAAATWMVWLYGPLVPA